MITALITYIAFLTLFIVYGIHHYEDKLKDAKGSISDYRRALSLAKSTSNAEHYTHLQLENKRLIQEVELYKSAYESEHNAIHYELENNEALQNQVKILKEQLTELKSGIHTGYINPNIQ